MTTLDDLELELRKLPGVRSAGFAERDELLFVQVHVGDEVVDSSVPMQAARIAYRSSDRPVAVELVRWRNVAAAPAVAAAPSAPEPALEEPPAAPAITPPPTIVVSGEGAPRVRLLAVLTFPDTDEIEVHLTHASRRAIGRAEASHGLVSAAEATLDALNQLDATTPLRAGWARTLESASGQGFLVAVEVEGGEGLRLHGLATGTSPVEAAARATLHAANRTVGRDLTSS